VKKTLKILGLTLAGLVGLLIAAAVVLPFVFDPNQYKDEIIRLVKEQTGRDLKIEKKIGWSFFPRLGVEAGGLELANAPGFGKEPFAKIDAAGVHVQLLPLLRGQIEVDKVFVHGLNLNLAKNAAGRNNWEDMLAKGAKPAPPETEKKTPGKLPIEALSIGGLDIRRANILWRDDTAGSLLAVRNLELSTGRFVSGEPLDLRLGFELARDKAAPVKAALQSRLTASPDALKLAKLDLKVDDSRLTGSMEIRNFASPAVGFDLALDKIDLDRYLAGGEPAATKKTAAGPKNQDAAKPVEIPLSLLRSLDIDGTFQIGALKAFDLHSTEARIRVKAKNGLIKLGPSTAKLYQGGYHGETSMDARGKTLQFQINERLEQVQLGPLLKDMQLFDHYSGAANIDLRLTAQGFDAKQITSSLNGNAAVAIKDGRIDGVDLGKFLTVLTSKADTLAKLTQLVPDKGDHTIFGQMNATFQIKNGVASNSDLMLRAADFAATGRGTADLVNERMDYRVALARFGDEGNKCKTLPVRIKGSFVSLGYTPVLDEVLKCQAMKQIEKKIEKELGEKLDKGLQDLLKKRR
jgi:AsmA protein